DVEIAREPMKDQYGIRMFLRHQGQSIKFEIVKEGHIDVTGFTHPDLGVPVLDLTSMFATKLLANADRWRDKATAYRDAVDLGMLIVNQGTMPKEAIERAIQAYGAPDIERGLVNALNKLHEKQTVRYVAQTL